MSYGQEEKERVFTQGNSIEEALAKYIEHIKSLDIAYNKGEIESIEAIHYIDIL